MPQNTKLKSHVDRIRSIDAEIKTLNGDKSDVFKALKSDGYNPKVVRKVLAILRQGPEAYDTESAEVESYLDQVSEGYGFASTATP